MQQVFEILQAAGADVARLVGAHKVRVRFVDRNLRALYRQVKTTAQQLGNLLHSRAIETASRIRRNAECLNATLCDLRPSAQVMGETSQVAVGQKED
jgi:hypothetical protein